MSTLATGDVVGAPVAVGRPPLTLVADDRGVWVGSSGDFRVQRIDAAS